MAIAVALDVTTEDAAPAVAPHRVSRDDAKDDIHLTWVITGGETVGYWQERLGGAGPLGGTRLQSQGIVAGLGQRCGAAGSVPLKLTTPVNGAKDHETDDILSGQPDGSYHIEIDARAESGWDS